MTAPVDWGRYELVVESTADDRTAASVDFYAGWYVPADTTTTPDTLELSLDAESYAPGEEARLRLVPRDAGTALVAVMANRLIDMKVVEVRAGENLIPLPVTEDWGAGAYVTATLLRPMEGGQGHSPARALGLDYAPVAPGDKALTVSFTSPPEADPRGRYTARMQVAGVAPGDQAYVTLAAVDLGILNLTGFDSPDPQGHYFGQRRLGMEIRDLYGRLIDPGQGEMGRIRSGGDAAASLALCLAAADRGSGHLVLRPAGRGGRWQRRGAASTFPAFNGTLRLMAVAWSQAGVGAAEQDRAGARPGGGHHLDPQLPGAGRYLFAAAGAGACHRPHGADGPVGRRRPGSDPGGRARHGDPGDGREAEPTACRSRRKPRATIRSPSR